MRESNLRLHLFVAALTCTAAVALAVTIRYQPLRPSPILLAFVLVALLAGMLTVRVASVVVSITVAASAAAVLLLGPAAGALVSGLSAIPVAAMAEEQRVVRGFFNFSQLALADLVGGWFYLFAGGRLLANSPLTAAEIPRLIVPLALLATMSFLTNTTLVGAVVALTSGVPFSVVWKSSFGWMIPTQAALTLLALALAQVVASEGAIGLALFVVPLLIARQFYERYADLKRAYAGTVRSLVAVIEAKDPYTRGHSERVAEYSVAIATRLGFAEEKIARIELAALLHDLGKVGISRRILCKESRLDDDEFRAIQTHPGIGAEIVESVPFLSDLVPLIAAHHERMDGTGYQKHLAGEDIPVEARIMSVSDAFDAMTSSRPYRSALSKVDAIGELRRCSGTQFDAAIVDVFVSHLQQTSEGAAATASPARGAAIETGMTDEAV